jgi:outer membrane protein assembly factor BamB
MRNQMILACRTVASGLILFVLTGTSLFSSDWPSWRGATQNGVSSETGLISGWQADGENLLWRADFTGRSTPVVLNGRVYVLGRVGEGINKQEVLASFDARDGKKLWEHRFNVFLTTVPLSRVGWANPVGDPQTGNIYAHGVGGAFFCFDRDGKVLWERSLTEEFGRMSGYGGRTQTPVIHEDLVILSSVSSGWGVLTAPRHRYFAFDKLNGKLVWVSTPGGRPFDMNTYSMPVVAEIKGRLVLVGGNADGAIEALDLQTGEPIWRFKLSKRGINSTVVVEGNRVYATHSEENLDEATMGRVVCIDGTGTGDVTETHEVWRVNQVKAGFATPAIHEGRLYVVDNSANLHCLDASSGEVAWEFNLGTVGKGSPVLADGKLYVTETNGTFHILEPQSSQARSLSKVTLELENRTAEIFGSPAIASRRIFFVTEEGLYCLGSKDVPFNAEESSSVSAKPEGPAGPLAHLHVVPAEVIVIAGERVEFRARGLDSAGRLVSVENPRWTLVGLSGSIDANGVYSTNPVTHVETGQVKIAVGSLEASARLRLLPQLPWTEDFEGVEEGSKPAHWIGAGNRFLVKEIDQNRVLAKPFVKAGIQRSYVYIGKSEMSGYTITADLMGSKQGRRVPDMGLIANRYGMALMGLRQEIQVHSWVSELRMATSVPFSWEPNVWYTMKMRVDPEDGAAVVRGKVWRKGDPEPESWTIEARDPLPNLEGTPGIFGQSYAEIFYDNIKVTEN